MNGLPRMNRRQMLGLSASAFVLGPAAAMAKPIQLMKGTGSVTIQLASPSGSWNGTPGTGYTSAAPTPTTMVGATAAVLLPVAHFLTVPYQVFGANHDIHVMARMPGGVQKVEFYTENSTPVTVTNSALHTFIDAKGISRTLDTFAVSLKASDWLAHAAGAGGDIYAKVFGNSGLPRTIGPFRAVPRPLVNGLPNDYVVLVTPDGKDNNGVTVTAPSNGVVVASLALAEAAVVTGAGLAAIAPMIKFMKTGTYAISEARDPTVNNAVNPFGGNPTSFYAFFTGSWMTITHAPGVVATIGRAAAPNYATPPQWVWAISRGMVEFRGPGIILDHKNWTYAKTDSSPAWWDNGNKHTLVGVASVSGPLSGSSLSSPAYNLYWNQGPNPASGAINNAADFDPGLFTTWADYEYVTQGWASRQTPLMIGSTFKETPGNISVANLCQLDTYASGNDMTFFNPGFVGTFSTQFSGAGSATFEKTAPPAAGTVVLTDAAGTYTIYLDTYPGEHTTVNATTNHAYTAQDLETVINGRAGWACTIPAGVKTAGWGARYLSGGFGSTGGDGTIGPADAKSAPVTGNFRGTVHSEWAHYAGGDWTDGAGRAHQDNVLAMNNVQRAPARFGTGTYAREDALDNSWFANNIWEVSTRSGSTNSMTEGSNLTFVHNYNDDYELFNVGQPGAGNGTQWGNNIITFMGGNDPAMTGVALTGSLVDAPTLDWTVIGSGNTNLSDAQVAALFNGGGDYRPGGSSVIPSRLVAPLEKYDRNYNLRAALDYAGPISSRQATSTAPDWPF